MNRETLFAAYSVLECEPGCSPEKVRAAFRQLVKVWHPDRFAEDIKLQKKATEKLKAINEAYEVLQRFHATNGNITGSQHTAQASKKSQNSNDKSNQAQSRAPNYKVGHEEVTVTLGSHSQKGHRCYKKTVTRITGFDGRWVSKHTRIHETKRIAADESCEYAAAHSLSFSSTEGVESPAVYYDYSSALVKYPEHKGYGHMYEFPDGSTLTIDVVTTDTLFHDESRKAEWCRKSTDLQDMEEGYNIYRNCKNWRVCVEIAQRAVDLHPDNSWGWIQRSFALDCLSKHQEAYDRLFPAFTRFPKQPTVPYNLACYCCVLGDACGATKWLKAAFKAAAKEGKLKRYRDMALGDHELASIRSEIDKMSVVARITRFF